jgi:hypothetical protein
MSSHSVNCEFIVYKMVAYKTNEHNKSQIQRHLSVHIHRYHDDIVICFKITAKISKLVHMPSFWNKLHQVCSKSHSGQNLAFCIGYVTKVWQVQRLWVEFSLTYTGDNQHFEIFILSIVFSIEMRNIAFLCSLHFCFAFF